MMAYPALVLNADARPVSVWPLSVWDLGRTMRNVMKGRVTVLAEHDAVLRSASMDWRPPAVVMLKEYVRRPSRVAFTRMNVFLRDDFTCQYCGERHSPGDLTFDHVLPRCRGGRNGFENVVAACVPCNKAKGHRTDIKPMRPPRIPTAWELAAAKPPEPRVLHATWRDYLYWDGLLETD